MSAETENLEKEYFLDINPKGTFKNTNVLHVPGFGKIKSSPEDVDAMFAKLANDNRKHLALFFHGGLVGEGLGLDAAARFTRFYKEKVHPYSLVWETGIGPALVNYTATNLKSKLFKKLLNLVSSSIIEKLGIDIGLDNFTQASNLESDVTTDPLANPAIKAQILAAAEANYANTDLASIQTEIENTETIIAATNSFSPEENLILAEPDEMLTASADGFLPLPGKGTIKAAIIAARCIFRFARKRHHGVWTTIEEEILRQLDISIFNFDKTATGVWSEMKKQAVEMWNSNEEKKGDDQYAGRYFLDKLAAFTKIHPLRIDLVGHSAGCVVICELVKLIAAEPEKYGHIRFKNIIFLAPACKCDLFHGSIMKYQNRYDQFRMFGMKQATEETDNLIQKPVLEAVYLKSLLYFVSGLCEDGDGFGDEDIKGDTCILGLEQHNAGKAPYTKYAILNEIHEFLYAGTVNSRRIVLTPTGEGGILGYRGQAIHHGAFDNDGDFENLPGEKFENSIRESLGYIFST